jgi:hypothetical protein
MKTRTQGQALLLASIASLILSIAPAMAALTPAQKCAAAKLKAAAKKADSKAKCTVKTKFATPADPTCLSKAEQAFVKAFTKAEAPGTCKANGDAATIETSVDTLTDALVQALQPSPVATKETPAQKCAVAKLNAARKKAVAKTTCQIKNLSLPNVSLLNFCLSTAEGKFDTAFTKAEAPGACTANGDAVAIEILVDTFVGAAAAALVPPIPTPTRTPTPGSGGGGPPTPVPTPGPACPCDGLIFPGPTGDPAWNDSFATAQCDEYSDGFVEFVELRGITMKCSGQNGFYDGYLLADPSGTHQCGAYTQEAGGPYDCSAQPLPLTMTAAQYPACKQILKTIAANDGVTCTLH